MALLVPIIVAPIVAVTGPVSWYYCYNQVKNSALSALGVDDRQTSDVLTIAGTGGGAILGGWGIAYLTHKLQKKKLVDQTHNIIESTTPKSGATSIYTSQHFLRAVNKHGTVILLAFYGSSITAGLGAAFLNKAFSSSPSES
jgi:hypothetical protein